MINYIFVVILWLITTAVALDNIFHLFKGNASEKKNNRPAITETLQNGFGKEVK